MRHKKDYGFDKMKFLIKFQKTVFTSLDVQKLQNIKEQNILKIYTK